MDSLSRTRKGPRNLFEIERVRDRERKLGWNQWKGTEKIVRDREKFEIEDSRGSARIKIINATSPSPSHLREHKFRHNFNDTIDPFCLCGTNDLETSEHFLLRCPNYAYLRLELFDNLRNNNMLLLPLKNNLIVQILLFCSENYDSTANNIIISSVMEFIIKSKRFEDALIQW